MDKEMVNGPIGKQILLQKSDSTTRLVTQPKFNGLVIVFLPLIFYNRIVATKQNSRRKTIV